MLHNTSFRMIIVLLHFYTNTKMRLLKSYTYDGIALKIYTTVQFSGDDLLLTFSRSEISLMHARAVSIA